ncbi:hypothetical protein ACFL2Q_20330 [Thermodesulfobacteriota bacterium]
MDRDKLVEAWKQYGATYNVFVPDEQPTPKGVGWDRPLPEPNDKGAIDPQLMKHWRFFTVMRNFLRHRYAEHGILRSPALAFDCLVPRFQKSLKIFQAAKGKRKKKANPQEWYAGVKATARAWARSETVWRAIIKGAASWRQRRR